MRLPTHSSPPRPPSMRKYISRCARVIIVLLLESDSRAGRIHSADLTTRSKPSNMSKLTILLVACFAVANAAMVRRDAPPQTNHLEEISKHAENFSKAFGEQLQQLTSAKNTEEFNKVLKDNSENVVKEITALSSTLNKALEETNGKAKEAISAASKKLEETVAELKKQNPQVEQQAKELGDKIKVAIQNTVQESDKLAKQIATNTQDIQDKLAPTIKSAYDNFVKQAEELQKKLHEVANKA